VDHEVPEPTELLEQASMALNAVESLCSEVDELPEFGARSGARPPPKVVLDGVVGFQKLRGLIVHLTTRSASPTLQA
jgi:hypothetical protein